MRNGMKWVLMAAVVVSLAGMLSGCYESGGDDKSGKKPEAQVEKSAGDAAKEHPAETGKGKSSVPKDHPAH